jgi:hypothetical protein
MLIDAWLGVGPHHSPILGITKKTIFGMENVPTLTYVDRYFQLRDVNARQGSKSAKRHRA